MLLAELRRKIPRPFACGACGEDVAPETAIGVEDALTSHVFGTLRYLPTRIALGPLLVAAGVGVEFDDELEINAWPYGSVLALGVGADRVASVGVEPDIELCSDRLVVGVEVKLGSRLGADPLQLPKEVLWVAARAGSRPWALLCITADHAPPRIRSFVVEGRTIGLGRPASIEAAIASYFEAARSIAPERAWPDAEQVRHRVAWLSWRQVARVLTVTSGNEVGDAWFQRALHDLLALLTVKGFVTPTFHGFHCEDLLPASPLAAIWRSPSRSVLLWERIKGARLIPESWLADQDQPPERQPWALKTSGLLERLQPIWRKP